MPSIAAHMALAKLISTQLDLKEEDFIRGNLLPDIIRLEDSHYKIKGKYFMIPNTDYFKENFSLSNNLYLGYYTHLLLDKYFLEEYVPNKIGNLDVFKSKIIYKDYNKINKKLVDEFNLDVDYLISILKKYRQDIYAKKLEYNLSCLSSKILGEPVCINVDNFIKFIYDISERIVKENLNESKYSKLYIYHRK